ncbi:MAG: BatD family protein [Tunicatimonas sp.]
MHQTVSLLRRKRIFFIVLGSLFICYTAPLLGQQASVELGRNQIGSNEQFTITLKIQNERLRQYGEFPQIQGFRQAGTSSSSSTNIVNGQISSSQSVTQTYLPTQEGTFRLPPFTLTVNEQTVNSPGTTITVGPPQQRNAQRGNPFADPFDDLFGQHEPQEFVEVRDNAFLSLTTSKEEVYLGEGFTTTLGLYLFEEDQAMFQFPSDLGAQLTEILKKIKPSNAWEENFNIENINGTPVTINGKRYTQYKIYQATFYPLNLEPIEFTSVPLTMIKYRVAKNPSFFGRRRQADNKTFSTQPKTVRVKDLPPHPLKDAVAVGNYQLDESVSTHKVNTGSSFNYNFKVVGAGNISAVDKPTVKPSEHFEVYPPSVEQNITRRSGQVRGSKAFSYYIVPNEPGKYRLGDLFNWIYFNPSTAQYDTLTSDVTLQVEGKSRKNELISEQDVGSFYDKISRADNTLAPRHGDNWERLLANGLILSMLVLTAVVVFRR